MNLQQFIEASNHNAAILQTCLKTRKTDLSKIIFWEGITGKDLSFDQLLAKSYDILGCCAIGAIPSVKPTGADGFAFFKDATEAVEIETKLCGIHSRNIHVGAREGLYWSSDPNNVDNRAALTSHFSGSFDARMSEETMKTKARHTALVCFDRDQNKVIDAWIMKPTTILRELRQRKHNATISVKLSRFLSEGSRIKTKVDYIGWSEWQREQIKLAKENKRFI
jgi:hypothetical protein